MAIQYSFDVLKEKNRRMKLKLIDAIIVDFENQYWSWKLNGIDNFD